jgi:hypothetical protein
MNTTTKINLEDHFEATNHLSYDENLMAIDCAKKVLNHLKRTNSSRYLSNIEVVEQIIENHKRQLREMQSWQGMRESA